MNVKKLELEFS